MPKHSFGHIELGVTTKPGSDHAEPTPETPFRILLLGDFSGRLARSGPPPTRFADRRPVRVDRDNFDQVLARFSPEFPLPVAGHSASSTTIRFGELDDFHPDRLFQRVEVFETLRWLRDRLDNPATFAAAAAEMRALLPGSASESGQSAPAASVPQPASPPVDPANLLAQILGEATGQAPPTANVPGLGAWQAHMQKLVEPHVLPRIDYSKQAELVALADEMTGEQMRTLLHHPVFQSLEATWRAVFFLVRRLATDVELQLFLLDVTQAELAADLGAADDLRSTPLYRLFVEQPLSTPGGQPWAVLGGLFTFDQTRDDADMLWRLAAIAEHAGAPFLAAASSRLVGCESLHATPDPDDWNRPLDPEAAEAWAALRQLQQTHYVGLVLPRFLLRMPYGKDADATEQFAFEELPEGSGHESYLWGNPVVACLGLLGEAFSRYGWQFRPDMVQEIDRLPLHVFKDDGESQVKPCAEVWLLDRAAAKILDAGIMPLRSIQGRDAVQLARFQSLADPVAALAGRWG